MRSTWSVELALAFLAAASVEAAGLTLVYLAVGWLVGVGDARYGLVAFAVATAIGLVLARALRRATWNSYLSVVPGVAIVVGAAGGLLVEVTTGVAADPLVLLRDPGAWLLGVAVLRGTAHAELDDEGFTIDRLLRVAIPGLVIFWLVGALSGLAADRAFTAEAFGATLTLVSSALLGLGLARLGELQVEAIDLAARRRWLALLLGVTALVMLVGLPLAALLQVPLATAAAGATGPLATLVIVSFTLMAIPVLFAVSALVDVVGHMDFNVGFASPPIGGTGGSSAPPELLTVVALVLGLIVVMDLLTIIVVVAAVLRRRRRRRRGPGPETREGESVWFGPLPRVPQLRRWRRWWRSPRDAIEAYRFSLEALAGRDEARRPGETPREHAARLRTSPIGLSVAGLAADYQLRALGGRGLSAAEEGRAHARWQRITRWAR